ncbi:trehalose-6-phosphate synthase domain protein [Cooperia oncophora]
MLTGQIMRSLDSNLEVGFFLHIPFQPPANFMTKYKIVADPILRGILRFTKVLANSGEGGCFFFSVERFDYTKGIMEKLRAWRRYFEKHPERKGLDVLYQIAVTNRRAVESYKRYQDSCLELAKEINESIRSESHPDWRPLRFDTDGLPRARLIAHYLAMDIGVVTPSKAKEMMVCNPSASLVLSSGAGTEDIPPPSTNSLGLPLIKQARAGEIFHVLEENDKKQELTDKEQLVERDMSLLSVLHDYNKANYQLNPVFVSQEDYNAYYGGISNGLLWPALHNLAEYIVKEYDDPAVLREHWCAYVRVNYQFGINAARNSRPQDFIWIHDYHLMLTGQIMRSLDSNLEVGFFLHIPFQPPANFMTKYKIVADPILRGILRFTKVSKLCSCNCFFMGTQLDSNYRDRERYVQMVREYIPRARVHFDNRIDIFTVTYEGWTCSLGVFPVSIKNEDFLSIANEPQCAIDAQEIKKDVRVFHSTFFLKTV